MMVSMFISLLAGSLGSQELEVVVVEQEALNNNGTNNPLLTRAAELSGGHRDSRLEILFTVSRGYSANQLQSVTAFMNALEKENVMNIPSEISLQTLNIQAVNRFPVV
ncbi:hypothetical protein Baya_17136 [Bagarius yarrelli]|uniref:Uncharacterized protein n=1 Tax=Bagarius yarrelli TaxID=175774 RepID=A0A556VXK0_BAGYA|nr:hypothetical protein Baya_17136 [Bagarius yarrelli]